MIFNLFFRLHRCIVTPARESLSSQSHRVSSTAETIEGVLHEVQEAGKEARLIGSLD